MEARAALIAANELLCYRPIGDVYEEWLDHVAELVRAAGGSRHRPSRCIVPRPARAMKLRGRLNRLPLKKAPWPQGAWPLGGTHSVRRQCSKSGAAKRSLAPKKLPKCSLLRPVTTTLLFQHAKTPRCSQL